VRNGKLFLGNKYCVASTKKEKSVRKAIFSTLMGLPWSDRLRSGCQTRTAKRLQTGRTIATLGGPDREVKKREETKVAKIGRGGRPDAEKKMTSFSLRMQAKGKP
jgi:hypothetical protein